MDTIYKLVIGPMNPKKQSEGITLQIYILKRIGLWPPETDNQFEQWLYNIWSLVCRGFFLYLYTLTQVLYFLNVENLADAAEGFFLLMTQISLLYKVEKFYKNRYRIQACEKMLRTSLFRPQNDDEDEVIKQAMMISLMFGCCFLISAQLTIATWAITPFLEKEMRLPIAAWYPFSVENRWVFSLMYVYQIVGISMSATFNSSSDTLASSLMAYTNGQVKRLGIRISKIGHGDENLDMEEYWGDKTMRVEKKKDGDHYREVIRCVKLHEEILKFNAEIQDIFKGSIFAQILFSCLICCMTLFLLANSTETIGDFFNKTTYLLVMVTQIFLFCWIGNEIVHSSSKLTQSAYFSNFTEFNKPTAMALLLFMKRTTKDIVVKAGGLFEVTLSLQTFLSIMKSSYSYFAVLQSMQE